MSLAERLAGKPAIKTCRVGVILKALDDADRDALAAALANSAFASRGIIAALRAEGHQVSRTTLQEHRNGVCCCAAR